MKKKLIFWFWLLFLVVFWAEGMVAIDPDFGWHMALGEYIQQFGVPHTDPFSYTMPSFHFVDHEWLTNFVLFWLYAKTSYAVLAMFFAILVCLALKIREPKNKALLIMAAGSVFSYAGVRPQVITWLFWGILLNIVLNEKNWLKFRYMLPFYFILWANLHGGFAVGVVSLGLAVFFRTIRIRKIVIKDWLVVLFSGLTTLINPYGIGLWREVWMQISDANLRWSIAEWMPPFLDFNPFWIFLLALSLVLGFKFRKKFLLEEKSLYIFFLSQGLGSTRHIPLWVFLTIGLVDKSLDFFEQEIRGSQWSRKAYKKAINYLLLGALLVFVIQLILIFAKAKDYLQRTYPISAVVFLRENLPKGNLFSSYNWGGYLIWNLPEKKVFIDGRMPSWRWNKKIIGESNYAFRDYQDLLKGEIDYREVFQKYSIDTVLWTKPIEDQNHLLADLTKKLGRLFGKSEDKSGSFDLLEQLLKDGWKIIYEDDVAIIYKQ